MQASLVLSVLTIVNQNELGKGSKAKVSRGMGIKGKLSPLLVAFAFGTVGSVAGAFAGVVALQDSIVQLQGGGSWTMASACLLASYIGGTSNFFETAGILASTVEDTKLLNLIAGVDIAMMIAYFAVLLGSKPILRKILATDQRGSGGGEEARFYGISKKQQRPVEKASPIGAAKSLAFAVGISSLATKVASYVPVMGISVPLSTLGALFASQVPFFRRLGLLVPGEGSASFMLCLFYAIIGLDCQLQELTHVGIHILKLMTTMLLTHFGTIVALSCTWTRLLTFVNSKRRRGSAGRLEGGSLKLDAETVIIASNVCIGGASTASSMASSLDPYLVVPSSIVGVLGYCIGTPIGLSAARALTKM